MKRIYLLLVVLVAFAAETFAQGSDLNITTTWNLRQGGNKLLVSGGPGAYPGEDTFFYTIKNFGPADIVTTDTIHIKTNYGNLWCPPSQIKKDSSKRFYNAVNLIPGAGTTVSSTIASQQRCDSVWATNTAGAVIPDGLMSNNRTCNNFVTTYWLTSVEEINKAEVKSFPNPATNTVYIKYDFGANAAAQVYIRDILGKIVYQKDLGKNLSGEQEFALDVTNVVSGIYMVELVTNGEKSVAKINIQK